ncbi:MAG: carboxypeptidase-like regulatory domain-containing protein, partial [Acidobacteriota bacterium]
MRSVVARIACLALLMMAVARVAPAQETINYASVSGRVTDGLGGVIPGVQVLAHQTETNARHIAVTDQDGRFRFPFLRLGPYELVVSQPGFTTVTRSLTLTVGAAFELPINLAVGGVESTVTVSADAPVLEAARSQIAGTVSQTEVRNLPLNGRNF